MFIYFLFLLCLASPWSLIEGLTVLSHPEIQLKHSKNHYNHTQIKSCEAPAYHCEEKYDCVYMHNTTFQKCGLNHIWLHVEHNVLSVPLSAQKDADECDFRYSTLDVAKVMCQKYDVDCVGITQDDGIQCESGKNGKLQLLRYFLGGAGSVLFDKWEEKYLSWVKKDFVKSVGVDLTDRMPIGSGLTIPKTAPS